MGVDYKECLECKEYRHEDSFDATHCCIICKDYLCDLCSDERLKNNTRKCKKNSDFECHLKTHSFICSYCKKKEEEKNKMEMKKNIINEIKSLLDKLNELL